MNRLRPRLRPWLASLLLALTLCGTSAAQAGEIAEYELKAVLFYRLAQFVYWPENPTGEKPPTYCIVGRTPLSQALGQLRDSGSALDLRQAPGDLAVCRLLFIARSESAQLDQWLARTEGRNIVTVSDIPGFARAGGMVELPLEGERVGVVINRSTAARKGVEFNAQLLRLARIVAP